MADQADAAISAAAAPESWSFYGLAKYLEEVNTLVTRLERAELAKAPSASDQALMDRKEELLKAQRSLRQAMGKCVEDPRFTKREKPLAEEFIKEQIGKLDKHAGEDTRAAKALDKLKSLQNDLRAATAVPEGKAVRQLEATIKQQNTDWKELEPTYKKWEAGRHSFKSNADLQAFKRRYEECKKGRETSDQRLEDALRKRRVEGEKDDSGDGQLPPGWAAVGKAAAKKAPSQAGAAARPGAGKRPAATNKPNAWGTAMVSFAQRLRAEITAKVREGEDGEEDGEGEAAESTAPPPPALMAKPPQGRPPAKAAPKNAPSDVPVKKPPPLPPHLQKPRSAAAVAAAAAAANEEEDDEEDVAEEPQAAPAKAAPASAGKHSASAKKRGKQGKKRQKGGRDDDEPVAPEDSAERPVASFAKSEWAIVVAEAFTGSMLQELLSPEAWQFADDEDAQERVGNTAERLGLTCPLGLQLPLEWREFVSLEIDGGPKRTSRRGTPPWVKRLQRNVPWLLTNYLTLLFFLTLLHGLSHFNLQFIVTAGQLALLLAPPDLPYLKAPVRLMVIQGVHILVWLFFVRAIWQMHLLVKMVVVAAVLGHAYAIAERPQD